MVAKRQRMEKPAKIEKRKVRGPQVKQTTLLAGPIYTGQAQGEKTIKKRSQSSLSLPRAGGLFSWRLWIDVPSRLEDGFSCYLLNKIEL